MAIDTVQVIIDGVTTYLTRNPEIENEFRATLAAPNKTSYNVNSGHYYPVTLVATNLAGTSTTINDTDPTFGSNLRLYVKEVTAPTITIITPTSGQYFATSTPTLKFRLLDAATNAAGIAISTLSFKVDSTTYTNTSQGVTVTNITGGYEVSFTPKSALSDGSHTLTVNVKDNDGNSATSKSVTFGTDTVAPTVSITSPGDAESYTSEAGFTVLGNVSDSTSGSPTVSITLNGTNLGNVSVNNNGNFSKYITLINGENTIVITATDLAGKVTTVTRYVYLDSSSPVIASVSISPNPVNVGESYTVVITVQ